jgi:hypothetical protein
MPKTLILPAAVLRSVAIAFAFSLAAPAGTAAEPAKPPATAPASPITQTVKLPITADVGICAHPAETAINTGGRAIVRVKGIEHYYLFTFDAKELAFNHITKATLYMKPAAGHLRKVAFCTVPAPWVEGTEQSKPQNGSTCFTHLKYPDVPWTPAGGTMLDATFTNPHMRWAAADVETDGQWIKMVIPPELIWAVAKGLSHGLVMSDERGQTMENHDVFTREQANAQPYILVEGGIAPEAPDIIPLLRSSPHAKPLPEASTFAKSAVIVTPAMYPGICHRIRISLSQDGKNSPTGEAVTFNRPPAGFVPEGLDKALFWMKFTGAPVVFPGLTPGAEYVISDEVLWLVFGQPESFTTLTAKFKAPPALAYPPAAPDLKPPDLLKNVTDAKTGWTIQFQPAAAIPSPSAAADPKAANTVCVPMTARNAWVGLWAVIAPKDGQAKDVTVELFPLTFQGIEKMRVPPLKDVRLFRAWSVTKDKDSLPEVLVPMKAGEKLAIPWELNKVAGQVSQPVFLDIWVPAGAPAGPYEGTLTVKADGQIVVSASVRIDVSAVTLSDTFDIVGDMNTYDSPAAALGKKPQQRDQFLKAERAYYALAHAHRMTLNVLPYNQAGEVAWEGAPEIKGTGADRQFDWKQWTDRYGPLLDGSAFSAKSGYVGPGADTPIHHMYLPFHENWPAGLAEHFKPWPPPKDYQEFLKWTAGLPPIDKCLGALPETKPSPFAHKTDTYGDTWQTAMCNLGVFAGKFPTRFQVYLNDKYNFRDPKQGGRGISLWLLDEPLFSDDFLALQYFGRLTRPVAAWARGLEAGSAKLQFRVDNSRPAQQRDFLDGVVDLNVCPDQLFARRHQIAYRKRQFGEEYWNYAMPPSFGRSNEPWTLWPVQSYCWGAIGTLPWQTIGSDGSLDKADATALMYPGRKFGLDEPIPSVRMKAWRDGLQDATLLHLLRTKLKWTDIQLRAYVGQALGLAGWKDGLDPKDDAPIATFRGVDAQQLDALRRTTLIMLGQP